MRTWLAPVTMIALLAGIVVTPLALRPKTIEAGPATLRLVVITPHNEQIRHEFERGFSKWHRARHGQDVAIDWRAGSGTSDIERILVSGYRGLAESGRMDEGIGYDVIFGGGDYFFGRLRRGVEGQSLLEPIDLGEALIREAYPEPMIADKPLYDRDGYWYGVALSSFGVVFNRDALADLGIESEPATWADLADPKLFGRVAMADPSHSGSVRVTYEAIVQRYGWERGWKTLRRECANARYFANTSSKVAMDVGAGEAAAGMCIDFYGRFQSEVVGERRLDYIAPLDATVVTADPVATLRGTKKRDLAERFVRFLLSREGQALWCYGVGNPMGPETFEIRRPPARRDMYEPESLARMVDRIDMFDLARPLPPDTPSYFTVLPTVLHAMAMDIHEDLKAAWRTMTEERDPEKRREMEGLFDALPFTPEELLDAPNRWRADPAAQNADRLVWTSFFRGRYRGIIAMGAER